jgi:antirestriction protein ArdC
LNIYGTERAARARTQTNALFICAQLHIVPGVRTHRRVPLADFLGSFRDIFRWKKKRKVAADAAM